MSASEPASVLPSATPADGAASTSEIFGIQEAANLLGVTMRTLRFYEDKGLIAPQRAGTARIYSRREIGRMQLILRGKRLGFSIREIGEFLDLYDADPEHVEQMRQLMVRIRERIADLHKQKVAIEETLDELVLIERQAEQWIRGERPKSESTML